MRVVSLALLVLSNGIRSAFVHEGSLIATFAVAALLVVGFTPGVVSDWVTAAAAVTADAAAAAAAVAAAAAAACAATAASSFLCFSFLSDL